MYNEACTAIGYSLFLFLHTMQNSKFVFVWLLMCCARTVTLLAYLYAVSNPSPLHTNEVVFALRVQHEHATHTALPALYLDTLVEFWMRSISPVALLLVSLYYSQEQTTTLDQKHYRVLLQLAQLVCAASAADLVLLLVTLIVFQRPMHTYTTSFLFFDNFAADAEWVKAVCLLLLAAGHGACSMLCAWCYKAYLVSKHVVAVTQVQVTLALGVQCGVHLIIACAHVVHILHMLLQCTDGTPTDIYTKDDENCEIVIVFAVVTVITLLLLVLPWLLKQFFQIDSNDSIHYLYAQFVCYPTVIGLYCVDKRSTGPTRLIAFCSIVASATLAYTMATSLAVFFETSTYTAPSSTTKGVNASTDNRECVTQVQRLLQTNSFSQGFQVYNQVASVQRQRNPIHKAIKRV
jgi:hypothetical protein